MSPSSPWPASGLTDSLTAFERAARQIAEEERRLRLFAEGQLHEYVRLTVEFATLFLADELDRRTRADPLFISRATPNIWRSLLQEARLNGLARAGSSLAGGTGNGYGWQIEPPAAEANDRWRTEAEKLRAELERLQAENQLLRALVRPAREAAESAVTATAPVTELKPQRIEPAAEPAVESGSAPATEAHAAGGMQVWGLTDVKLPVLPALAPSRFADQLRNWARESLALCALGITGWSMRFAIAELMSARLGGVQPNAGSLRRVFDNLARRGFWHEERVVVRGLHRTSAGGGETTLILVRLTELGREVLQACGIQPAPSEWDLLLAAHGGQQQIGHAGLVCTFTYHARLRGWATAVCPPAPGPSQPDVRLVPIRRANMQPHDWADEYDLRHQGAGVADRAVHRRVLAN